MPITHSCGHQCSVRPFGISIVEKGYSKNGTHCAVYSVYCHECYCKAVKESPDNVLFDELEVNEWLGIEGV